MDLAQPNEEEDQAKPHTGAVIRELLLEREAVLETPDHLPTTSEQLGFYRNPLSILWHPRQLWGDLIYCILPDSLQQSFTKQKSLDCSQTQGWWSGAFNVEKKMSVKIIICEWFRVFLSISIWKMSQKAYVLFSVVETFWQITAFFFSTPFLVQHFDCSLEKQKHFKNRQKF